MCYSNKIERVFDMLNLKPYEVFKLSSTISDETLNSVFFFDDKLNLYENFPHYISEYISLNDILSDVYKIIKDGNDVVPVPKVDSKVLTKSSYAIVAYNLLGRPTSIVRLSDNYESLKRIFKKQYMMTLDHPFGVTDETYRLVRLDIRTIVNCYGREYELKEDIDNGN